MPTAYTTVVATDCISGNVTRIPEDVCIPQNGGWCKYVCTYGGN
jgi:hypothetical protein